MSWCGNCYDNAHAESFWSRFKTELLDGGSLPGLTEATLEISHHIPYYNAERRHSALGYLAPNHFETHLQTTSQLCSAWLAHLIVQFVQQQAPKGICYFWLLFLPPSTSLTMTSASRTAYRALRDYLNSLLSPTHPDQALDEVPAALRPDLEAFMRGKTEYQDDAGRRMIYAYDLAAWASDLIYGAGLTAPLPLATLNVAELRAATWQQAA